MYEDEAYRMWQLRKDRELVPPAGEDEGGAE
jgi:hypothetical protein